MSATGPGFAAEDLTLSERLQLVFYAPRTAFEAVRDREMAFDWLVPALLVCAIGLAAHYLTLDAMTNLDSPAVTEHLQGLGEADQQRYQESAAMLRTHGWMMVPVGYFTSLVLVGWVLMVMGRSLFQAEVSYRQALVIKAYAALVIGIEWALRGGLVLMTGDPGIQLGLGALLPAGAAASLGGRVLMAINPFDLWQIGIMGVGLSALVGVESRKTTAAILVLWLVWLVGGVGIETLSRNLPPPA